MESLRNYFQAERAEALFFLGVGLFAFGVSFALLRVQGWRAMGWPLVIIGLIQIAVGAGVYFRTPGQVRTLEAAFQKDAPSAATAELQRMEPVMRNFHLYKAIEIVVILAGVAGMLKGARGTAMYAAGLGCLLQGALMLALDLPAEARGRTYIAWLKAQR